MKRGAADAAADAPLQPAQPIAVLGILVRLGRQPVEVLSEALHARFGVCLGLVALTGDREDLAVAGTQAPAVLVRFVFIELELEVGVGSRSGHRETETEDASERDHRQARKGTTRHRRGHSASGVSDC